MRTSTKFAPFVGVALALSAPAGAAVIGFDAIPGANLSLFATPYQEDGFTVTPTSGMLRVGTVFGNPAPSLIAGPFAGSTVSSVDVTAGGALFSIASFQLASQGTTFYTLTGFSGLTPVYTLDGSLTGPIGAIPFETILSGTSQLFDRISFGFAVTGGANTSVNLDNIDTTLTAAVPEPATWAMLIGGFGLIGGTLRRRAARTVVRFA